MNDRRLHAAALGLALCACLPADRASAYCRMRAGGEAQVGDAQCPKEGAPLFWNNTCLSYAVDARGSRWFKNADGTPNLAEVEALVDQSFLAWQDVDCNGGAPDLIFKGSPVPSTCKRPEFNTAGNVNTIAFLDPWKAPCADPDDPGYEPLAFAVTIVWHNQSTGEILDADMMINDELANRFSAGGPYADCPDTGCPDGSPGVPGPADLRSIITHEAGHFIGIGHSDVADATMFSKAERTSAQKRTLAQDDIDAVCDIYPPGSLDESCIPSPTGGLLLNCETTPDGDPIACDDPAPPPSNASGCRCSTGHAANEAWLTLLFGLVGLTLVRWRPRRRDARS
jgi:MYXO-CTERM domain-containing protein